jgi:alcohol dehydrogenase (NADP+)
MKKLSFSNGDSMPVFGLGTWKSTPGEVYAAVKTAIAQGYRHIDCAAIYANESEVGKALKESFDEGIVSREEMWITSKLWCNNHAPEDVEPALKQTLKDLQLDHIDLYLIHWPVALKKDVFFPQSAENMISLEALPLESTWKAMEALAEKKLARHIGVSNFSKVKIQRLIDSGNIKPEVNQVELHPYLQQPTLVEYCMNQGIHLTAYSPLGSPDRPAGMKAADEPVPLKDPVINDIARQIGCSAGQVLISWSINRGISVIPKSVNPARLKQNLEAVSIELSQEQMKAIAALNQNRRLISGEFWALEGGPYTVANLWDE